MHQKHKIKQLKSAGLVACCDIRPGNWAGLFCIDHCLSAAYDLVFRSKVIALVL